MTFFAGHSSPPRSGGDSVVKSSMQSGDKGNSSSRTQSSKSSKSTSNRRKSPVKGALENQSGQNKISMSPLIPGRAIATMNKQKELLKRDICKKRNNLERDLNNEIRVRNQCSVM